VRAGVDEHSHRVSRGVCVVKLKAISLLVGAVVVSSLSMPTKYGAGSPADAADAIHPEAEHLATVPEFVPVVNFSEFVLATEQFASENRQTARDAAEALSAKFASASTSTSDFQGIKVPPAVPFQQAAPVVASAPTVQIPDPGEKPVGELADPVKVASAEPEPEASPAPAPIRPERVQRRKSVSTSEPRQRRPLRKAMGLGMTVESAENMPRPSSFARPAKTIYTWNGSGWSASGKARQ
jgi:hypothetical protein